MDRNKGQDKDHYAAITTCSLLPLAVKILHFDGLAASSEATKIWKW